MSAVEPLPEMCPRMVKTGRAKHTRLCGETIPCPYHGTPRFRTVTPPPDPKERRP